MSVKGAGSLESYPKKYTNSSQYLGELKVRIKVRETSNCKSNERKYRTIFVGKSYQGWLFFLTPAMYTSTSAVRVACGLPMTR